MAVKIKNPINQVAEGRPKETPMNQYRIKSSGGDEMTVMADDPRDAFYQSPAHFGLPQIWLIIGNTEIPIHEIELGGDGIQSYGW